MHKEFEEKMNQPNLIMCKQVQSSDEAHTGVSSPIVPVVHTCNIVSITAVTEHVDKVKGQIGIHELDKYFLIHRVPFVFVQKSRIYYGYSRT